MYWFQNKLSFIVERKLLECMKNYEKPMKFTVILFYKNDVWIFFYIRICKIGIF